MDNKEKIEKTKENAELMNKFLIQEVGLSNRYKGFYYISDAIFEMINMDKNEVINCKMTYIYTKVGKMYDKEKPISTLQSAIERDIRSCIKGACKHPTPLMKDLFNEISYGERPYNSLFLHKVSEAASSSIYFKSSNDDNENNYIIMTEDDLRRIFREEISNFFSKLLD